MYSNPATGDGRRTPADARVCAVLGLLVDQNGSEISIFGKELADLADTQREYASRALARLQREGVIKRTAVGRIVVLDREALR